MLYLFISCTLFKPKPIETVEKAPPPIITKETSDDGLTCHLIDVTGDKKPNIKTCYQDGSRVVRKEMDINNDNKMDIVTHYDEASQIAREDLDLDYDGIPEWVDHYRANERFKTEIDTNVDQLVDIRLFYQNGKVYRKESDTDFDGTFDLLLQLDEDGDWMPKTHEQKTPEQKRPNSVILPQPKKEESKKDPVKP